MSSSMTCKKFKEYITSPIPNGALCKQVNSILGMVFYHSEDFFIDPLSGLTYRTTKKVLRALNSQEEAKKFLDSHCFCDYPIKIGYKVFSSKVLGLFDQDELLKLVCYLGLLGKGYTDKDSCCMKKKESMITCIIKYCKLEVSLKSPTLPSSYIGIFA